MTEAGVGRENGLNLPEQIKMETARDIVPTENPTVDEVAAVTRSENLEMGQSVVEKPVCLTNLREASVNTIHKYIETLKETSQIDKTKFWRVEDFFEKEGGLDRVMILYEGLLSETVTTDEQSLLIGHLNFVLKRAIDQDLNSPENYVSHGFNHTLNVVDYVDQIINDNPTVLEEVSKKYGISRQKAKFLFENVALFHDFGYPEAELQHMPKVAHSMTGADVINHGETEVSGKKMAIKEVLARIFSQDSDLNEEAANDIRNAVLMHNADKFDQNYTVKLVTSQGNFLVDGDDLYRACDKLDGIKKISIYLDKGNKKDQELIENRLNEFFSENEKPKIEWTDTKYKGRKLDPKNKKGNFLGLEYFKVVLTEEPLLAIIRLADNMDMTYNRLSSIQRETLFKAYYYAIGDKNSPFYKGNKRIEAAFEKVESEETQLAMDDLKREVAEAITTYRIFHEYEGDSTKISDEELLRTMIVTKTILSEQPDAKSILSYWRTFIVDRLAKPIGEIQVGNVTKFEIKKAASRIGSTDFPHFVGCEPIFNVRIREGKIEVEVESNLYDKLNEIEIEEVVKSNDQVSIVRIPAGQFQIRRLFEACKGIRLKPEDQEIPIYINGNKYTPRN